MHILGFSAWFHDSTACLLRDGALVAVAEEERFSRRKHTPEYPKRAIEYCLTAGNVNLDDIDAVVFYLDPVRMIFENIKYVASRLPRSVNLLRQGATVVPVGQRYTNLLRLKAVMCREHGAHGRFSLVTLPHYRTHQGAAFLCSPFDEAAIVTMDVAGDGTTQVIAAGRGNKIDDLVVHRLPHAWGMLYASFTHVLGFKHYDEYKVMGMSAYGEPRFLDFIEDQLYRLDEESGQFELNLDYFSFQYHGLRRLWSDRFLRAVGPVRQTADAIEQRHYDLAASIQRATERFGVRLAKLAKKLTSADALVMAGGVAQNVLMNQAIVNAGIFERTFFQPLASDVGSPLGAALYHYHCQLRKPRVFTLEHLFWGPSYERDYETAIAANGLRFTREENPAPVVAQALADGAVVALMTGRMEAGPRALGGRSILADPRRADMKDTLNLRVKHREHFRPFAPSCLREHFAQVFEPLPGCESLGYMIVTANVLPTMRERVPAITHQDGTARPQLVSREFSPLYWSIISEFHKLTGVPLVVNTSFNDNEPIVCTPQDAINCFMKTRIDLLVLDDHLVYRTNNLDRVS